MKNYKVQLFTVLFVIISYLGSAQTLVGVWKMANYESSQKLSGKETERQKEKIDKLKKKVILTFNEDGTFVREGFTPYAEKGKWEYLKNDKKIILATAPFYIKDTINIGSLSDTEFVTEIFSQVKKTYTVSEKFSLKKSCCSGKSKNFPEGKWKVLQLERTKIEKSKSPTINYTSPKSIIILKKDGKFVRSGFNNSGKEEIGTWRYDKENKILYLKIKGFESEEKIGIVKLTGKKITLIPEERTEKIIEKVITKITYRKLN